MITINAKYLGGLRVESTHEPSGEILRSVAPKDNNGDGSTFSPTDLLATATLNCMITIVGITANNYGFSIEGTTGHVEKHMIPSPRRVGKLVLSLTIPQNLSEENKERVRTAAHNCPVVKSLSSEVEIDVTITFGE